MAKNVRLVLRSQSRDREPGTMPTDLSEAVPGPSGLQRSTSGDTAAHSTSSNDDSGEQEGVFCPVCRSQPATANMNFGGRSCVNCRVFFSRVVIAAKAENDQSTEAMVAGLRCRCQEAGGRRVKYKTECKRCRFKKCLQAGLSPDKVKKRTRSVKSRKQAALQAAAAAAAEAAAAASTTEAAVEASGSADTELVDNPAVDEPSYQEPVEDLEQGPSGLNGHCLYRRRSSTPSSPEMDIQWSNPDQAMPSVHPTTSFGAAMLQASLREGIARMENQERELSRGKALLLATLGAAGPDFSTLLATKGESGLEKELQEFWEHTNEMIRPRVAQIKETFPSVSSQAILRSFVVQCLKAKKVHLRNFAEHITEFKALHQETKMEIFEASSKLYLTFLLAKTICFGLKWLIDLNGGEAINIPQLTREELACTLLGDYPLLLPLIRMLGEIPCNMEKLFVIASCILSQSDRADNLRALSQMAYQSAPEILQFDLMTRLKSLCIALEKTESRYMIEVYIECCFKSCVPKHIFSTGEEVLCFDLEMLKFEKCFEKLTLGQETLKEFVYSAAFHEPFGPNWVNQMLIALNTRSLWFLQTNSTFRNLTTELQHRIWTESLMPYYTVMAIKRESADTLEEQLASSASEKDFAYMQSIYNPVGDIITLPPYTFDLMNKINRAVSKKSVAMYYAKMPRHSRLIMRESQRTYLSVMAAILFISMDETMGTGGNLSSWYLNSLRKKFRALEASDPRFTQDALNEFLADFRPWMEMMIRVELQNNEAEIEQAGIAGGH